VSQAWEVSSPGGRLLGRWLSFCCLKTRRPHLNTAKMSRSRPSILPFILITTHLNPGISTNTWPGPSSPIIPTPLPQVHIIKVGAGGFIFSPQQLPNIPINDTVSFVYYRPDHSVAHAEYGLACVPYGLSGRDRVEFWSYTQNVGMVDEVRLMLVKSSSM
jgi:hypothetical protein